MKLRHLLYLSFLFVVAVGCDAAGDNDNEPFVHGVFVVNQGNFGDGNGSVTVLDPGEEPLHRGEITGIGSILQSAALIEGTLYLMANSAERIDIFDAATLEQTGQITEVISPRYMVATGTMAYVTNLWGASGSFTGGNVTVIDLVRNEAVQEIPVGNNPEGLAVVGRRLHVANHGFGEGSTVNIIDLTTHVVIDTVDVDCDGPRFVIADADDEVFVFCTGRTVFDEDFNVIGETDGAVRVLDGRTGEILKRLAIDGRIGTEGPGQDAFYAAETGRIYAVKDQSTVLVFDTGRNVQVGDIGPFPGDAIGAVAFDEQREHLYLGRSSGFVESGSVTIHTEDGEQVGAATAGIAPAYIILQQSR